MKVSCYGRLANVSTRGEDDENVPAPVIRWSSDRRVYIRRHAGDPATDIPDVGHDFPIWECLELLWEFSLGRSRTRGAVRWRGLRRVTCRPFYQRSTVYHSDDSLAHGELDRVYKTRSFCLGKSISRTPSHTIAISSQSARFTAFVHSFPTSRPTLKTIFPTMQFTAATLFLAGLVSSAALLPREAEGKKENRRLQFHDMVLPG